jgi:type IV pilus assembly protein PilM
MAMVYWPDNVYTMANFLKDIFSFKKKPTSVLGIDIGSSAIKVVQLRRKGEKAVLETYGELALGPYGGVEIGQATNLSTEKLVEALSDLMSEKEVNLTSNACGMAIPFSSSLMSLIEMPMVSYQQLSVMIPLEARKYIPVPISEVTLDWSIIPKEETVTEEPTEDTTEESKDKKPSEKLKKTDVLLVAIHNETIARYQEVIRKTALESSFFEIEIFSTMRAVLEDETKPVMIFDMGAASTKLYILERGIVRLSHTINRGSQDITSMISKSLSIPMSQAEIIKRESGLLANTVNNIREITRLSLDQVFSEANQVVLNYERKYGKTLGKIVLVGGGSALKGLADLAQQSFQTPVAAGHPFSKTEAPAFLEKILEETGPEFAVAVGVALRRLQELG